MSNIVKKWENERFSLLLQDQDGYLFAHCYVYEEKLSTFKEIKRLSKEAVQWAYEDGYDGIHSFTENEKFAKMIPNSKYLQDISHKGKVYGVYKWELK